MAFRTEWVQMNMQDIIAPECEPFIPKGDAARQAIDSLRGYAYQVTAAALAWLDVEATSKIYLEVAEDYAVVAANAVRAVQVKDTKSSGTITLGTESVRDAIANFVTLTALNDNADVHLRYFTTSEIGTEKALRDRPGGEPGLLYWRRVAKGADASPLREVLDSDKFPNAVREFVKSRGDDELRRDLFRKVHWDCGKPDLASLRKEFQDRLVVIGRDTFDIPAPDALRLSSVLVNHVLEKSIKSSAADRVLTRADLISVTDHASRVSVPIAKLEMLADASSLLARMAGGGGDALPVTVSFPVWLVDSSDLPAAKRSVARPTIEKKIEDVLRACGACFVFGASGVGKSSVARAVAERVSENCFIVDFRDAGADETRGRLNTLLSRLGGMRAQVMILEDLNQFNDPGLAILAGRVFEALSRRDIAVIATSYAEPTPKALSSVSQNPSSTVGCPYFSEEESASLVELHGGDPSVWGKLAHVSGAFGHPQLVHAFIAGVAARGWPPSEISAIIGAGLSTGDITAEREVARRSLISVLPESSRSLLYRLSMTIGSFNRAAALHIAAAPPPITHAGESLDALIGPWIETTGRDSYRVSPLAGQSGKDMLLPEQQQVIHHAIASHLVSGRAVDTSDVDKIIMHAMLGNNQPVLTSLTFKLLTSGDQVISFLAENSALLRLFETTKPIYSESNYISAALRLLQFKVLAAGKDKGRIEACVRALLRESGQMESEPRAMFQIMSLATVLGTLGIANHLENWIELLVRFHAIASGNRLSSKLLTDLESQPGMGSTSVGVLFAIGSSNLATVAKLEQVFAHLDRLEPVQRELFLKTVGEVTSDYSVLINSPWLAEQRNGGLDALDAAERYRRMAEQTSKWGLRRITTQCWIARAIMLDEYADDFDGALRVLDEAAHGNVNEVLIERARAKVYWRAQDHKRALSILRGIADVVGKDNNIERAFALREAAISAANCDDWAQAENWFLESKVSASATELPNMQAMSVGLGADAAVAAFESGQTERCLRGLADALVSLGEVDPDASLQCAHCHHVIRHTVLWVHSRLEGREVIIDGESISMRPGVCSNPDPAKGISELPLGSVDIAWYMLAESELMSRTNVGIADGLSARLSDGPIPMLEIGLRSKRLWGAIEARNPAGFAHNLLSHIEGMAYFTSHAQEVSQQLDLRNPPRGTIPSLSAGDAQAFFAHFVNDAVLAYAISCACAEAPECLLELAAALDSHFGKEVMCREIFSRAKSVRDRSPCTSFEEALIDSVMAFGRGMHAAPKVYCVTGLRFLQQAQHSSFRARLMPIIAIWQRDAWGRIVASERFQLSQPQRTVPAIEVALSSKSNDERFLSSLVLAAADACTVAVPPHVRARLQSLVD